VFVFVLVICLVIIMVSVDAASPQGFKFVCANLPCPSGSYQNLCPQCSELLYIDEGTSSFQCYCFNSGKQLQDVSTIQNAGLCTDIEVTSDGAIECASSTTSVLQNLARGSLTKKKKTSPPSTSTSTGVLVDFVFRCEGGTCPSGPYQQYCPLCKVSGPDLSCLCFDSLGQMLLPVTTMFSFAQCTSITTTETGGYLACPGNSAVVVTTIM